MAAKKKNSSKKHSFKHVAPTSAHSASASSAATSTVAGPKRPAAQAVVAAEVRDFSYVKTDVRRVLLYGGLLILLELALWGVIDFTSFGQRVYDLVRL